MRLKKDESLFTNSFFMHRIEDKSENFKILKVKMFNDL